MSWQRDDQASYWPLGRVSYSGEVEENFSREAMQIGVITVLWTLQELALKEIFRELLHPVPYCYAEAIWERQGSHQARRDLLSLAVDCLPFAGRRKEALQIIVARTKSLSETRNDLIHSEFVVRHDSRSLFAKSRRGKQRAMHYRRLDGLVLDNFISELERLLYITESLSCEYVWDRMPPDLRDKMAAPLHDLTP